MNKQDFIANLRSRLSGLPEPDIQERLSFYREMIEDRVEEGVSEQVAIAEIGAVDEIAAQITEDYRAAQGSPVRAKPRRRRGTGEIVLLALGSPIWISLLIAAFSIVLSLYVALWAVVVSLWAGFGSLAACALGGVLAGGAFAVSGNPLSGVAMIGAALVCAGCAILWFFGCKAASRGTLWLTRKLPLWIKDCFAKGEVAA